MKKSSGNIGKSLTFSIKSDIFKQASKQASRAAPEIP